MVSSRRSSPVAALMTRTSRSWTSIRTRVRAWVRPMPMWWSLPLWRRVSLPSVSTRSARIRSWASLARSPGGCLGPGVVGGERCLAVGQGAVQAAGVVVGGEGIQEFLELGEVSGLGLGGEPFLQGLPESLDLALGLGVVRAAVLLPDPQAAQLVLQGVAAASAAGEPRTLRRHPQSRALSPGQSAERRPN